MNKPRQVFLFTLALVVLFACSSMAADSSEQGNLSPETEECVGCHISITPGIVKDWMTSRHYRTTPSDALKLPKAERRISVEKVPEKLAGFAVGCFECHSRNPDKHADNFEHMGYMINVVVSPNDCSTCHPVEANQYAGTKKAMAYRNLMENSLYRVLVDDITGLRTIKDGNIHTAKPTDQTLRETCLACHGTVVEVRGMKEITTANGDIMVPDLTNWPNQGVGRVNPDGSFGACTACHPRHGFSIEVARKPYTCAQCHLEPDVPAWNVYKESKHGNIYLSKGNTWNFDNVPWILGEDFTAPTCAVCHNSLIVNPDGEVLAERSHDFGARLWVRLFGLIYSHPQPRNGDVTGIRNADGLPLPTTFSGQPALDYLISEPVQKKRKAMMTAICNGCHSTDWINGHFAKLDNTIKEVDKMTLTATQLMTDAWEKGVEDNSNPFDESIEKRWIRQWLFYGNSIKYASAMTGAPDHAAFHYGWWNMIENLQEMKDLIELKAGSQPSTGSGQGN
jgi:hypothetical protein